MHLGEARTPDGMRLYAIGDVHGCDGMLADMHQRIGEDLAARSVEDHRIIHIGDYGDRGSDSARVIARLVAMTAADRRVTCLKGNHDQMLLDFLDDPLGAGDVFLANGGDTTVASYGIASGGLPILRSEYDALAAALGERMPATHRAFLDGLPYAVRFGDYFFCHAGIRPGVPLERQDPNDLIWIREPFLSDRRDHGAVVVHGHTPVARPEVKPNRINIDTGAVYGGPLTCVVLDGVGHRFLSVGPG